MRLENNALSFIVNFLLGISWATVLVGAITSFLSYYFSEGLLLGLIAFFMGMIPGMVLILLLEMFITQKERSFELKKQTKLLEEILLTQKNS